jgi:hypothetical protein
MSSQLQVTGEAKIRDIQGPVVANSGVITALDGAASQYVRGDGTLADFPTSSGGGSSVSYYLNSSVSQGTIGGVAYRELSKEPIIGAGTDIAISTTGYVASYLTDANDPDVLSIPGGNFNCEFYFSVNNNTGDPFFYAELYKYDGTTFTLLGSSVGVPEYINQGTIIAPYYFAIPVATAALALTDRLAIRIYVNVDGRTVTLHTENGHLCQVVTTLSKGMVSLNNLTDQSQFITTGTSGTNFNIVSSGDTHTFNLPVASAANTGKLSSSDWSVFNAKEPAITAGTTLQYYRGDKTFQTLDTTAVIEATNLYFTDARARAALSFAAGSGAYNSTTGVITIPTNTNQLTNGASFITLTSLSAGTGISYNNTTGVITNSAPDQTVSLTAGAGISITGTYPSFTIASTITQYTDALARAAISLTTTGSSGDATYNNTTGVFNIPNYGSALSAYLPLAGGTMTGQIVLKEGTNSTDYTKGLRFPNDPYGGGGDTSGLRLYPDTSTGTEAQILELYCTNDTGGISQDKINLSVPSNDFAMVNGFKIWNAGNLTPQTQLNGTGFVKASGTTISYDNNTYLTTSAASSTYVPYTGALSDVNLGTRAFSAGNILGTTLNASQNSNTQASLIVGNAGTFRIADFSNSGALVAYITNSGSIFGSSFVKSGGSSNQFLKADGSVDSTSYFSTSGGIISGNIYMQSSGNPSQLLAKGVNTEFWVDSQYGGGTARAFINRNTTGNQATLMFSTGVVVTNGTAWAGVCDYSMGMTNDGTGNFYIGAGDLFSSSNRALTITSSRNIGIGTSSPNGSSVERTLHLSSGSSNYATLYVTNGANSVKGIIATQSTEQVVLIGSQSNNPLLFVTNDTERMRITSGGNVGIGDNNPTETLVLKRSSYPTIKFIDTTDNFSGYLQYHTDANEFRLVTITSHPLIFSTNDTEKMRISSGGYVGINTQSPRGYFNVKNGSGELVLSQGNGRDIQAIFNGSQGNMDLSCNNLYISYLGTGTVYSNGGVLTNTNPSDANLKENITDLTFGLNEILQLRPVSYDWKNNVANQSTQYGFIAQEVQKVLPQLVTEFDSYEDEKREVSIKRLGLDKDAIFVSLVKAIQELEARIKQLENK